MYYRFFANNQDIKIPLDEIIKGVVGNIRYFTIYKDCFVINSKEPIKYIYMCKSAINGEYDKLYINERREYRDDKLVFATGEINFPTIEED